MRVLVTGGAGFLGSHLCERLLEDGHGVICLDNLFTGDKSNVAHLLDGAGFEFVRHDVVEPITLEVDWIFNLASVEPPRCWRDPVRTVETSVVGALNMLDLAKRVGARVLLASGGETYGDADPACPADCYGDGNRAAEALAAGHHWQHGTDARIARVFPTFGPRMRADGVVSGLIAQALRGEPMTVHGDGSQTRSFCYVDDMVSGLVRLMEHEGEGAHLPVNLGNPREATMLELADVVARAVGCEPRVSHMPLPQDDPARRRPDIARARSLLGWEPTVPLEEGVEHTVAWFRFGGGAA